MLKTWHDMETPGMVLKHPPETDCCNVFFMIVATIQRKERMRIHGGYIDIPNGWEISWSGRKIPGIGREDKPPKRPFITNNVWSHYLKTRHLLNRFGSCTFFSSPRGQILDSRAPRTAIYLIFPFRARCGREGVKRTRPSIIHFRLFFSSPKANLK